MNKFYPPVSNFCRKLEPTYPVALFVLFWLLFWLSVFVIESEQLVVEPPFWPRQFHRWLVVLSVVSLNVPSVQVFRFVPHVPLIWFWFLVAWHDALFASVEPWQTQVE